MTTKKTTYVNAELDWAENQLAQWKKYIDNNPINMLEDRMAFRQTARGAISVVSATIESQIKSIRDTMKEYLQLLEVVDRLREREDKKEIQVRAGRQLGSMAEEFLNKRK